MTETDRTVQQIFNLWFWNFQNSSLQQFDNLFLSTIAILKYFNKKDKYSKEICDTLPSLFFRPITTLKEIYGSEVVSKNTIDWNISQISWCYYRDTKFRVKLGTEYYIDSNKEQEKKKLLLSEMITILSLFKQQLFERIVTILIDENIDIFISLPIGMKELEQIGG